MLDKLAISLIICVIIAVLYYACNHNNHKKDEDYYTKFIAVTVTTFVVTFVGQSLVYDNLIHTTKSGGGEIEITAMLQNIDTSDSPPF